MKLSQLYSCRKSFFILFYGHRILWIDNDGYVHEHFVDFKFKNKMLQIKNCLDLKFVECPTHEKHKTKMSNEQKFFYSKHRCQKWGRRGRDCGPNILASCGFGTAVFIFASCLFYYTENCISHRSSVTKFQWFDNFKLLTRVDPRLRKIHSPARICECTPRSGEQNFSISRPVGRALSSWSKMVILFKKSDTGFRKENNLPNY